MWYDEGMGDFGGIMSSIIPVLWMMLLCSLIGGCWNGSNVSMVVDEWLFREAGGTIFSSPEKLTLKEVHLDNGTLVGRQVIVEGIVEEVNPLGTFLVISDNSARLLVVLTDVANILGVLPKKTDSLQVFGSIESGKKGLPFLKAVALRLGSGPRGEGSAPHKGFGSL